MPINTQLSPLQQLSGLSVDFGGTKISAARVINGTVEQYVECKTDGDAPIETQIQQITRLLDQLSINANDKVGLALAGKITKQGVWQAVNSKTLSDITDVPLKKIIQKTLARNVNIQNDATAAMVGEYLVGAAKNHNRAAFITVSTGVGGGIILEGKPVVSDNGLAGHIGFTTSRIATSKCGRGRLQTVESIASGNALAKIAQENGHSVRNGKQVFEAHLAGELWATNIVTQSANAIAELCANLNTILGLDIIAIGGSVGLADGYLNLVEQALQKEPKIFRPKLVRAKLGREAALIGILADIY